MTTSAFLRAANQPPPLEGYDLFSQDAALVEAVRREGAAARQHECAAFGRLCGGAPLELGRLGITGHVIEDARDVAGDHRIGGEEGEIGVDAGGDRMVVARADMDVGGERAGFPPHHHRQLGMRLELDEAVDHLRTGALQRP